jgi:hypothetical protein
MTWTEFTTKDDGVLIAQASAPAVGRPFFCSSNRSFNREALKEKLAGYAEMLLAQDPTPYNPILVLSALVVTVDTASRKAEHLSLALKEFCA